MPSPDRSAIVLDLVRRTPRVRTLCGTALTVIAYTAFAACSAIDEPDDDSATGALSEEEQELFDCNDPSQRLECSPPTNLGKRYVCHATGSRTNPYNKISVPIGNPAHVPGEPHNAHHPADQAPGASGDDIGNDVGLGCDCEPRSCDGICSGAADGAACDDGDLCTGSGSCAGDECEAGLPTCVSGTPVDECNVQSGACDPSDGSCGTQALPAGTSCGDGEMCDGAGDCVECLAASDCPGTDEACASRACVDGTCGVDYTAAGTACGMGFACDGHGACVGVPHVVLNEVESNGGVPGDWVELYNAGTATADVSGWRFLDNDNSHTPYAIPAGTTIPAGGYLVLEEASFGFGLGGADSARIFDAQGAPVDSYSWTSHAVTTYGRCPNGTGSFVTASSSTKGAANDCTVAIKVNEVESSGGVPGDWVELYNAGAIPVNVGGWVFKDNDDTHNYSIPAGTTIAPNSYLVLDEAAFGFGLGAADSARLFNGTTLIDSYAWTTHAVTTYGRCPNGTGSFGNTSSSTKGAANDCTVAVRINEVESSGGVPGDWVEIINAGAISVDVSGWIFKDNDDTHAYSIPAGTIVAAGGYLVLDEAAFGFGLGSADSARLFNTQAVLIDSYAWTAHAATTYGRCPNGTGAFATTATSTKGAANGCSGGPSADPWPGQNNVTTADGSNVFGGNLSGLFFDAGSPNVLWAVRNGPSTLFRLEHNGTIWTPAGAGWSAGKTLRYPDGTGSPDAEDVTKAEAGSAIYVATERDNDVSGTSRLSILRFDTAAAGSELIATNEWNLTADLPAVGSNLGLEAITWIPDSFLVSHSFFDSTANHAYNPAEYPNHGTGLFFVGVEATGQIHAYALNHSGGFTRIASFASGDVTVKALAFDRDVGYLWTTCGSACGNQTSILVIDTVVGSPTFGKLKVQHQYARPTTMANLANEGIAFAPESQCVGGKRTFLWSDDGETDGHAIRTDTIPCGAFAP